MTPEERFTSIENFLNTVADHQAQFMEQMAAAERRAEAAEQRSGDAHAKHDQEIAQIRELIHAIAGRIIIIEDNMIRLERAGDLVKEAQQITEQKLNALIDTVDRIIRNRNGGQ
jgi:hypothetical protein